MGVARGARVIYSPLDIPCMTERGCLTLAIIAAVVLLAYIVWGDDMARAMDQWSASLPDGSSHCPECGAWF